MAGHLLRTIVQVNVSLQYGRFKFCSVQGIVFSKVYSSLVRTVVVGVENICACAPPTILFVEVACALTTFAFFTNLCK